VTRKRTTHNTTHVSHQRVSCCASCKAHLTGNTKEKTKSFTKQTVKYLLRFFGPQVLPTMLLPCTSIDAHTHTHALITSLSDMTAHHRSVQHDLNIKTDQKVCISLRELCINVRTTTAESSSVTQQPNQRSRHKGLGTKLLQGFLESFITETTDAGSEVHLTTLPQFRNSLRGTKVRQASNPHVIPYHCLAIFLSLYHTFTPSEPKAFPLPLTNVLRSVLPQHGSVNHVHVHITPSTKMRDKRLTCNPKEEHQITKRGKESN